MIPYGFSPMYARNHATQMLSSYGAAATLRTDNHALPSLTTNKNTNAISPKHDPTKGGHNPGQSSRLRKFSQAQGKFSQAKATLARHERPILARQLYSLFPVFHVGCWTTNVPCRPASRASAVPGHCSSPPPPAKEEEEADGAERKYFDIWYRAPKTRTFPFRLLFFRSSPRPPLYKTARTPLFRSPSLFHVFRTLHPDPVQANPQVVRTCLEGPRPQLPW